MVWFRDHWYEEVLRQLRQGLTKCYVIAFDNRGAVNDATITPHTLNFVKKLGNNLVNSHMREIPTAPVSPRCLEGKT